MSQPKKEAEPKKQSAGFGFGGFQQKKKKNYDALNEDKEDTGTNSNKQDEWNFNTK